MQKDMPLQSQLDFYLPPCGVCDTFSLQFTPELIKIFYLARVLFSETSTHRIKTQVDPLLSREQIFSPKEKTDDKETKEKERSPINNDISLERIHSMGDVARLLPREHLIYTENVFLKKLANRELIRIDYEGNVGGVVSADRFLSPQQVELERSQKIYLLFDTSTSMNGENFKKLYMAKAIAIEYLRRVYREKPQIYFRTFHSEIGELAKVSTQEEIHDLIENISQLKTGGGRITYIGDAVVQAIEDIKSDPELEQAEILVMTDGFGPIPKDLKEQLGDIKLNVLLIPDLDIEKILQLYPTRKGWEDGGPDGTRPMPVFWKYYSNEPPPMRLENEDLCKKGPLSYKTASKSVNELKILEILQGLNQIYMLKEVCDDSIFSVITSILDEEFPVTLSELESIEACIKDLSEKEIKSISDDEKLQFLQTVNFLLRFLMVAKSNTTEKELKIKIKELKKLLEIQQARILADPWIQSILKVDKVKIDIKFDTALKQKKDESMPFMAAIFFLIKLLAEKLIESFKRLKVDYKF